LKAINKKTGKVFPDYIQEAAGAAWEKLDKYYPTSDGLSYIIGTMLDPRCKLDWYKALKFRAEILKKYKSAATDVWTLVYKPNGSSVGADSESTNIFAKHMSKLRKVDDRDELQIYLAEKVVPSDVVKRGALDWWKIHEGEFPNLSKMARDFLSAAGTGVPVERLFSCGPDLLSHRRQSLSPERIQQCLCLKSWTKFKFSSDVVD
jgi:hAT family C-terminal dimerisation region